MIALSAPRTQAAGAPTLLMMPNMAGMVGGQGATIMPVRAPPQIMTSVQAGGQPTTQVVQRDGNTGVNQPCLVYLNQGR